MGSGGLTSAFRRQPRRVMDVYAAQKVFGRGRSLRPHRSRSAAGLHRSTAYGARIERLLGSGYQVEAPSARAQQFENLSQIYAMTANITSLFALFIGMFIIFNTFSIAVTQRRSKSESCAPWEPPEVRSAVFS